MKLLLVDDHPLFLEGLRNLIQSRGMEVVGCAHDGLEALEMARALKPEVILMDVRMPRCGGLEATRLIKTEMSAIQIVMLTASDEDEHLFEAIKSGASGYLLKSVTADDFFSLLTGLERGEAPLSPGLAARILDEMAHPSPPAGPKAPVQEEDSAKHLSPRQVEILSLVAHGRTYKEIGAQLKLTERTIKYHMGEILRRLHVRNRAEVIAYSIRTGLVKPVYGEEPDAGMSPGPVS
jgi:DNA-binding NarL/FixJ family response regulator